MMPAVSHAQRLPRQRLSTKSPTHALSFVKAQHFRVAPESQANRKLGTTFGPAQSSDAYAPLTDIYAVMDA
jgi:hypothetical protein